MAGFPVITCDVFDTAVMRRLARQEDIHLLTGLRAEARGLLLCSASAFAELRLTAECATRKAAKAKGYDEVQLAEICTHLAACGVITDPAALAALECAVTLSLHVAIETTRFAVTSRADGQRLVFLSDTTLPGDAVVTLLRACGYGGTFEVLTSSDTRRNKASGRLFAYALTKLGVTADQVLHIGDDPVSDVRRARQHGIMTRYLPRNRPVPEPEAVARQDPLLRLAHSYRRSRVALTGTDLSPLPRYAALLLVGFTLFVLDQARRRGIGRIYFLARDGHIPLLMARRIIARSGQAIDLHYLEVSRQAITVPGLTDDLPRLADLIGDSLLDRPLRNALDFLGIDDTETTGLLDRIGLDPNLRLTRGTGMEPIRRLFVAGRDLIGARLRERRDAAMVYLDQTGFLRPGKRLVVDVGWRGSTQKALMSLTGLPGEDLVGCYVGLLADALGLDLNVRNAVGYLFGFGEPRHRADIVRDGYALLELFLSSPLGSVSHYAHREDGTAVPVLTKEREPGGAIRQQAARAIEAGCLAEFEALDTMLDGAWPTAIAPDAALFDLRSLLVRPTRREVTAINAIPFIHGIEGTHNVVAANPVPLHELVLHPRDTLRRIGNSPWRGGAVRASLPWPIPDMTYADLRHRSERLLRLLEWRA